LSWLNLNQSVAVSATHVVLVVTFWLVASGIPVGDALVTTLVILAVGLWGLVLIGLLDRRLIDSGDVGLWIFGPALGLGALLLLLLRSVVAEEIFLFVFVLVPIVVLVANLVRLKLWRTLGSAPGQFASFDARDSLRMSVLVGVSLLTPVRLVGGWGWVFPVVGGLSVVLLLCTCSRRKSCLLPASLLTAVGGVVAISAANFRRTEWWRVAEGIPFDETILESLSNGLVEWGPTTNPLHHELGGASSFAYHHLLYLIVGLINRFASPEPYQVLLVAMPVIMGAGIVSTLLLITKVLSRVTVHTRVSRVFLFMVLVGTLTGLDTDGTGGPSSWFGTLSILGSMVLLQNLQRDTLGHGALLLFVCSLATVSFSKGTFLWMPVVVAVVVALLEWRVRWPVAIVSAAVGMALALWFRNSNVMSQTYFLSFWPRGLMAGEFDFSLYSLLVFIDVLLNPIVLGVPCIAILAAAATPEVRQLTIALSAAIALAIGFGLFLDANGAGGTDLFFAPGIIGSTLTLLCLVSIADQVGMLRWTQLMVVLLVSIVIVVGTEFLGSETLTSSLVGATLIVILLSTVKIRSSSSSWPHDDVHSKLISGSALFVVTLLLVQSFWEVYPELSGRSPLADSTRYEDWYGSPDFIAMADFVKNSTDDVSLFAYSLQRNESQDDHEIDFRPAALMSRKFLALDPLFEQSDVSPQLWRDIEESRQIGMVKARRSLEYLSGRGVSYVLVGRSQVDPTWLKDAQVWGANVKFENDQLILLGLNP